MAQFAETFNQADSTDVGPTYLWSETSGAWDVYANQLRLTSNTGLAYIRPDIVMTTDNYRVEVECFGTGTFSREQGITFRADAIDSTTFYSASVDAITGTVWLRRVVDGVATQVDTVTLGAQTWPFTFAVEIYGDSILVQIDDEDVLDYVDTENLLSGKCVGIMASVSAPNSGSVTFFDSFTTYDLSTRMLLTGSIEPTGASAAAKAYLYLFTGAITVAGVSLKRFGKRFTSALRPRATLRRVPQKMLRGSSQPYATMQFRVIKHLLSSLTPAGELVLRALGVLRGRFGHAIITVTTPSEARTWFLPDAEGRMSYVVGQKVTAIVEFRLDGVPTDPTAVSCRVRAPDGGVMTFSYPSAEVLRRDVGLFAVSFYLSAPGTWWVRPESNGIVDAVDEVPLAVEASAFATI